MGYYCFIIVDLQVIIMTILQNFAALVEKMERLHQGSVHFYLL